MIYLSLLIAGILAGAVNFFYIYLSLPNTPKSDTLSLRENEWTYPIKTWQLALVGYCILGIAGAFLTPVINEILSLKGVKVPITSKDGEQNLLVIFGYGLIFGFSTTRLLTSLSDTILKRILEKINAVQNAGKS